MTASVFSLRHSFKCLILLGSYSQSAVLAELLAYLATKVANCLRKRMLFSSDSSISPNIILKSS